MKFGKWFKSQQTPDLAGYYIPYTSVYPFIDRAPLEPPPVQLTKKINSVVDGERSEVSVLEELRGHIDVCSAKTGRSVVGDNLVDEATMLEERGLWSECAPR